MFQILVKGLYREELRRRPQVVEEMAIYGWVTKTHTTDELIIEFSRQILQPFVFWYFTFILQEMVYIFYAYPLHMYDHLFH